MQITMTFPALSEIAIDRNNDRAAYLQLTEQVRNLIVGGRLAPGLRMPSSRELAAQLGLARKTIVAAYDQLIAEGYLSARQGAGTFVEDVSFIGDASKNKTLKPKIIIPTPNSFGEALPLSPCTPDSSQFPRTPWARAAARGQRNLGLSVMFEPPNGGFKPLREAIAAHLWAMRGLRCQPEQVIITAGFSESLALICQTLLKPGMSAAVENPGYQAVPQILSQFGITPNYTSVCEDGIDSAGAIAMHPDAVCVSASRQFPMGVQLSLPRRAELVSWAAETAGWIIEDDYDCEFRFGGQPLQSMFAMDNAQRTLYLGSLSKVLFPRLRISFLIAPPEIAPRIIETQNDVTSLASLTAQAALAEFINTGQFATHIRHMRRLYAARCDHLSGLINEYLGDWLLPRPACGGFHFAAMFTNKVAGKLQDTDITEAALKQDIGLRALSSLHAPGTPIKQGLLIGFAGTEDTDAIAAVQTLRTLFEDQL